MMNQTEIRKLWALLAEYYGAPKETRERMAAWELALSPFPYEQVKKNAIEHARKSPYYPKISELTANLEDYSWMDEYIR